MQQLSDKCLHSFLRDARLLIHTVLRVPLMPSAKLIFGERKPFDGYFKELWGLFGPFDAS
jgi:hypothetical protein